MELLCLFAFGAGIAAGSYVLACVHRWLFSDNLRDELIKELRREAYLWNATAIEYQKLAMRLMRRNQHDDADWWKQN